MLRETQPYLRRNTWEIFMLSVLHFFLNLLARLLPCSVVSHHFLSSYGLFYKMNQINFLLPNL